MPALLYRSTVGTRGAAAAGLLQATSLPFIVASTSIGVTLDLITPATAAAFVAAGLGSALIFPVVALGAVLRGRAARLRPLLPNRWPADQRGACMVAVTGPPASWSTAAWPAPEQMPRGMRPAPPAWVVRPTSV